MLSSGSEDVGKTGAEILYWRTGVACTTGRVGEDGLLDFHKCLGNIDEFFSNEKIILIKEIEILALQTSNRLRGLGISY